MSDREVLFMFHYGGDFVFDISRPVYNGGKQKMRFLATNITYECLVKEAIEASNGDSSIQNLTMQYLHHNGRAFSMASIDDDNDVRSMFKASGDELNEIYLYVFNGRNKEQRTGGDNWRFKMSYVRHSSPGKSRNSSGTSNKNEVYTQVAVNTYLPLTSVKTKTYKMEPEDINTDVGNNSARGMWIGREFQDRQTFRNTLAKFAIYGNFTLRPLKTNMTKVIARCRDQECPWRIHASIVESGPQFKVRTYNPNHKCSRPMMGMAHR
ncbi:Mutator-like protein transposase [Cinnamomum micranthum f. kanehirae]|uniref:Mutator-like protein transposase n=1 Tax=Cinnamomum micranthum f. kanehirae TaxID=337451 RepID=A0A3S4NLI4_9MAGN|nr:Mutator-like protein transposase [Cinnamomum micranthum f. kanehirae]